MAESIGIEQYLAEQTQLPLEEVEEMYRAGCPWPIIFKDLERMARQDAVAAGVPLATAQKALDQLCDMEGAHLTALAKDAERAMNRTGATMPNPDIPEVQAIYDHPIMRNMFEYSQRVALRIGQIEPWMVFALYLAILNYAWDHPDFEGA